MRWNPASWALCPPVPVSTRAIAGVHIIRPVSRPRLFSVVCSDCVQTQGDVGIRDIECRHLRRCAVDFRVMGMRSSAASALVTCCYHRCYPVWLDMSPGWIIQDVTGLQPGRCTRASCQRSTRFRPRAVRACQIRPDLQGGEAQGLPCGSPPPRSGRVQGRRPRLWPCTRVWFAACVFLAHIDVRRSDRATEGWTIAS